MSQRTENRKPAYMLSLRGALKRHGGLGIEVNMSSVLHRVLQQVAVQASVPSGSLAFSTTACLHEIRKMARMRVVDNSTLGKAAVASGKPPRVIHVYNKKAVATLGDKVLLAIKGQKKRAYVVGVKQKQRANVPRFDTNNVVLIEDNGTPIGTRIAVPVPSMLRGKQGDFTKILSIATRFV